MENQLGARIAKLRRACGLTQETLGGQLGVSAAAVSKWETGAACPDVTLLCPLARALRTNVNALLAFEQTMTREQLTAFSEAFVQLVRGGRRQTALEDMERLLAEYPGDTALRLNCAALISVLEMSFPDESEETKAAWHEKQRALYEEAALSENVAERESASCALASMDLAEGRLDAAQARLDALPESREDTTLLRVRLLKKRGEDERALEVVQKQLYRAVAQTLERLTLLMEAQTDAHDALQIAQIYRQVETIFSVGGGMSDGLIAGLVQDDSPEYIGGTFVSPLAGGWKNRVTSEMGGRYSPITGKWEGHRGLDMAAPKGTEIRAAANGTVLLARYGHASYGNYVVVGHGGGVTTLYAHCSALNVTVGQAVSAGDVIAFVGSTGDSTGDHLHLEVNDNGTLKNPRAYLP